MADVIRDVIIQIRLKQLDNKLKVPDVKPVKASIQSLDKATVESAKKRVEAEKKVQQAREEAAKQSAESARQINEENLKAAEGFKTFGDGALTAARGAAFLFTSTDDGLKKLVENVAIAQGAFDLFKGSVDIVKGLREGIIGLTTASKAASTANTALAASNTAVATSATSATTSSRGFLAALGPIGIALALAATAYAAYVAWQRKSKQAAEDETKAERDKAKALRDSIREQERANSARASAQGGIGRSLLTAGFDPEENGKRLALRFSTAFQKSFPGLENLVADAERRGADFGNPLERAREILQSGIVSGRGQGASNLQLRVSLDRRIEVAKLLFEREKLIGQQFQKNLETKKQELQLSRDNLAAKKEELATAKEAVRAEKEKVESAQIAAGRLNARQRAEAASLADKFARGQQLSRRELERVEQFGNASPAAARVAREGFRRLGEDFASDINQRFGGRALTGSGSRQVELEGRERTANEAVNAAREFVAENARAMNSVRRFLEIVSEEQRQFERRIAELEADRDQRDLVQ